MSAARTATMQDGFHGGGANHAEYHHYASMTGSSHRSSAATAASVSTTRHAARPSLQERATAPPGTAMSNGSSILSTSTIAPPSSISVIDFPVAANSIANRGANATSGLYQNCKSLKRQLCRVRGFAEQFLIDGDAANGTTSSLLQNGASSLASSAGSMTGSDDLVSPTAPSPTEVTSTSPTASLQPVSTEPGSSVSSTLPTSTTTISLSSIDDPVTQLLRCFRFGSSLCYLFNALELPGSEPLAVNKEATLENNRKACQRGVAHFTMALTTQLGWQAEDVFRVSDLYALDTNGTVKVIHTVTKFVQLLDDRSLLLPDHDDEQDAQANASLDPRGRVLKEILDSERKHVQDLEVLQSYQRKLVEDGQLSQDTIAKIFMNLDWIVDFSRKFLIDLERQRLLPTEHQRYGSLFVKWEEEILRCYRPYCVCFKQANQIAVAILSQENSPLTRVAYMLDPAGVDLSMFHIKPVQRLLKYHLLFESLLKESSPSAPYYADLVQGVKVAKSINDNVNEETGKEENRQAHDELLQRVEDWKGHDPNAFGPLLLQDNFTVIKSDVARDYQVYLFRKIVLCCKEILPPPGKKDKQSKSNSMIRKSASSTTPGQAARRPPYQLKGRIFINNIVSAVPITSPGPHPFLLSISWRGDSGDESFSIKCRSSEQLAQWTKAVNEAVQALRLAQASSSSSLRSNPAVRRLASPHSQFPNTPQNELAPMLGSSSNLYFPVAPSQYGSNPLVQHTNFDDEGDDGYNEEYEPSTGRLVNNGRRGPGTQSLPPNSREERERELANGRPRAQTEDSNSAVINQWRSQTPSNTYPPAVPLLPRTSSNAAMQQQNQGILRHSASRTVLRGKQSQEWSSSKSTLLPSPTASMMSMSSAVTMTMERSQSAGMENMGLRPEPARMLRQGSQGNMPTHTAPPPMRSRSASSPHVYQLGPAQVAALQHQQQQDGQWSPYPPEGVHPSHLAQSRPSISHGSGLLKQNLSANASSLTISSTTGSASSAAPKRFSSSSTSTDRSSGDSSQVGYSKHLHMPMSPTAGGAAGVKLRVIHGADSFVIMSTPNVRYHDLIEKVARKLHICGARPNQDLGTVIESLRIRYEDEDGDRILMTADDDVSMAFEWFRTGAGTVPGSTLTLYAE